jgi:inner membrane protein
VHRALRYAVLFLAIPFAALFLVETLARKRLHPVQYLLVGLANCVFYLLLLATAEHLPFTASYLGAAAAVSVLTAFYVGAILPVRRIGLYAFLVLTLQYGYLYSALESEDYALLIGSVGLFVLTAAAMATTRKIDWYGGTTATEFEKNEDESEV